MTNIWTQNGNRVAVLMPGPGDIFVVTTINGKRVATQPIAEYERALKTAHAFAAAAKHPIKVLCMSLHELLAFMGVSVEEFLAGMSPEVDQEFRQLTVDACMGALREDDNPSVRADAHSLLVDMGILKGA